MDYRYLDQIAGVESRKRPAGEHPKCAACGYDLFGTTSNRCSECGHVIDSSVMDAQSAEVRTQVKELEEALRAASLAWKLVVAGVMLLLLRLVPILGPGPYWVARCCGFLCGFIALFLRLAVIRVGNVPAELTTPEQRAARDSFIAAVDIAGGLFLMMTAAGLR